MIRATGSRREVRIGMVSFAHMHAYSYARAVRAVAGATLAGIADDSEERGQAASRKFGAPYYRDVDKLLAADLDAVIVCSENARHKEHVIAAAQAGKHVLCEKPIATTREDAAAMVNECRARGVQLATAFPVRHAPPVIRAKQLIDEGRIGKVLAVSGTNHGRMPGDWFIDRALAGGGAVLDHTVHVADLLRWFLADEAERVYAEIDTRMHDMDIDDCGTLCIEFRSGAFATLDPSWSRPKAYPTWGDVTMEIIGTAGVISVDVFAQVLVHASDPQHTVLYRHWGDDMDLALVKDFVQAVRDGTAPAASGIDGMRALEIALAAYESARSARPVELSRAN
ncbi:MAG: Gfo/Idh/MocA family oxidoreductase [Firmicutes bacterium]|nr:Gfo/Idh/MocA family oxidoreductase [Bacillota bacterium]